MALINTTHGSIDESLLEKREGFTAYGSWVEYYIAGELVHRSVTVSLESVITLTRGGSFKRYGYRWALS